MNIQRFTAATSREALAKARLTFGDNTLILSNRPTEHGVEVVAAAEDTLATLNQGHEEPSKKLLESPLREAKPTYKDVATRVEDDAAQLAMSTLSFQDYVRERMLRKRHENGGTQPTEAAHNQGARRILRRLLVIRDPNRWSVWPPKPFPPAKPHHPQHLHPSAFRRALWMNCTR